MDSKPPVCAVGRFACPGSGTDIGIAFYDSFVYNYLLYTIFSTSAFRLRRWEYGGFFLKKNNWMLAAVLLGCLILFGLGAIWLDGMTSGTLTMQQNGYSVVISEICTKNENIIADNDGKYRDYIELYNSGEAVDLGGFILTDGKKTYVFPAGVTLVTGEYRVVFLGDSITGFSLGASGGDCIQLRDPAGNILSQANTAAMEEDQVMLLSGISYTVSRDASPGYANDATGLTAFREGIPAADPAVVISEVLLGNASSLPDENGIFSDVIELHNTSGSPVNLGGYYLSDSMEQRQRFRMPDRILEAGEYLVIYCDADNYIGVHGEIHTNFGLSHGETLILTDNTGCYTGVTVEHCGDDVSLSLTEDTYAPGSVSLGFANTEEGMTLFRQSRVNESSPLVISELLLSSAEVPYNGSFCDAVEILNRSGVPVSTQGWYLSDGGDPYEYALPEQILLPGECLVLVCSPRTTGFSLSENEVLRLTTPEYTCAPLVSCVLSQPGQSISLLMNEDGDAYAMADVTLGYENTEENHMLYLRDQLSGGLRISELMSANQSYLVGPYSTTADWIELYNASGTAIDLSEYALSDEAGNLGKYPLPDKTLDPGEYCVIFLKKDSTNLRSGYSVLPCSLSSEGEQLYLTMGETVVDYVLLPSLSTDESYGRTADSPAYTLLASVTPGKANGKAAEKCAEPVAQLPQGSYDDVDYLDIVLSGEGNIYYTLDCTDPGANAILYTGPVRITKTTVFRVVCREPGKKESDVVDLTYVVNEYDNLPVVSLVTDPDNLWDYRTGIYVSGPNASDVSPYHGANFWMDWEKPASVSLFETDGTGFSANCGIKIFGAFTRALAKKSFSCLFRDVYGDAELAYPLFGEDSLDTYESFILRTSGQDAFRARMRDVVITSLMGEYTDVPVQDYKPVVLYLNGQYWGIYYIREKINENYVAGHYNVESDTVTIVKYGGWTSNEYRALLNSAVNRDMTVQENYDWLCSQIDIDNYIDFIIAEMWIANTDNGNVKYYKNAEGKWTWFLYDTDLSLSEAALNSVQRYLSRNGIGASDTTCKTFAARLIHNKDFRDKFLTRLAWQMNNIWTEENLLARIDEIEAIIEPDMAKECERWGTSYASWQNSVGIVRLFSEKRNGYMLNHIQNYFSLTDEEMRSYGFQVE